MAIIKKVIFAGFIYFIIINCSNNVSKPKAESGVINLTSWDFEKNGEVALKGEWEFYWQEHIKPQEFFKDQKNINYFKMPNTWNNFELNGEKLNGQGFATYRLNLKLNHMDEYLCFYIKSINTAYSLFINEKLIQKSGEAGTNIENSKPAQLPKTECFQVKENNIFITLHVSNFHHSRGGPRLPVYLGTHESIRKRNIIMSGLDFFLLGGFLLMFLYHIGLYLLRKNDRSILYFGIICLILAIRQMVTSEILLAQIFNNIYWELLLKIEYLTFYIMAVFFLGFFIRVFPNEIPRKFYTIVKIIFLSFIVFLIFPARIYTLTMIPVQILYLIVIPIGFSFFIKAFKNKRIGSGVVIAGFSIVFLTVINDILVANDIVQWPTISGFGIYLFIFSQAYLLSKKFVSAFDNVEKLSESLSEISKELSIKNKKLLEMDKLKDEFLANTSHELRTPLSGIIGIADSLYNQLNGKEYDNIRQNLFLIIASGKRLNNLVNDVLDFSRLKNKDIKLNKKSLDLYILTEIVITFIKAFLNNKKIEIVNNIPKKNFTVYADEDRLQQILYNLIGNAIKFTEIGFITINAKKNKKNKITYISIQDTGIGIAKEDIHKIFNSFVQIDGSETREHQGVGLGLSITKSLIELHKGKIWAESELQKGSVFEFSLPDLEKDVQKKESDSEIQYFKKDHKFIREVSEWQLVELNGAVDKIHKSDFKNKSKILAVDDDPINLKVIENQLSSIDCDIITALNGKEALDIIDKEENLDLILLDVMMPRISGYEVCKKVREKYSKSDLPIIIFTAKTLEEDLTYSFNIGANDYITKPIKKSEFLARVNSAIELKKAVTEKLKLSALEKELEMAAYVQKNIITPQKEIYKQFNFDIDIKYLPLNQKVSGDYYCMTKKDNGIISIFLADAIGHGIQAAFSTSRIDLLNKYASEYEHPHEKFIKINDFIFEQKLKTDAMFSAFILEIKNNTLHFSSAGHCAQVLLKRREKKIYSLKTKGSFIGAYEKMEYQTKSIDYEKGDCLLLFTDGLYEQFNKNKKEYGTFRLNKFLEKKMLPIIDDKKSAEINSAILNDIDSYRGKESINDDATLIAIKF
ncbi:MAG: ATP-binding protein [Spirochaetia bacterium]|nr:ATP-binding protein [Spirochaetia bacterium]